MSEKSLDRDPILTDYVKTDPEMRDNLVQSDHNHNFYLMFSCYIALSTRNITQLKDLQGVQEKKVRLADSEIRL